jgi:hypothetical protein
VSQQTIVAVAITLVVVAVIIIVVLLWPLYRLLCHQPVSVSAGRLVVRPGALLLLNTDN